MRKAYLEVAHGNGKDRYQTLTDADEKVLCQVLPDALRLGQREAYDAISNELEVSAGDERAHRIMAKITMFFATDAVLSSGSSPLWTAVQDQEPEPEAEPESGSDSDSYF
jgi:regulator of sigma D